MAQFEINNINKKEKEEQIFKPPFSKKIATKRNIANHKKF